MRHSMTGFAHHEGVAEGHAFVWEIRGVNGKGLDLRLRLPDICDGLEAYVRAQAGKKLARGNVQINLRVTSGTGVAGTRLDRLHLSQVLDAMTEIEAQAMARGLSLAPSTAAEIVGLRGVLTTEPETPDADILGQALRAGFDACLASFIDMRLHEGAALTRILTGQIDQIETLVGEAETTLAARADAQAARLGAQMAKVLSAMSDGTEADPQRIAQELALLAVKSDITEEIDRLRAHVTAARDLLKEKGAVGRKLDFLSQEFNREANTLCSKSGDAALTQTGLALKTVIDQMREQVQNME